MNIPSNFWKTAMIMVGILAIFLVVISVKEIRSIAYVGSNPNLTNTITVDGTGDAVAIPDVAVFSFSVTENAKTVADAQSKATEKINAAIKVIKDAGVAEKDIQTTSYTINPHYDYPASCTVYGCPTKQVLNGYDVSESIQVKIRDLSKAGSLFTSIGALDVQNVNGLSFSVDNEDTVKAEARAKAIKNAQDKANQLAKQLGVRLVRITSFYETGNPIPYAYGMGGSDKVMSVSAVAPRVSPEIATGEQKITNNVTITYEIE